MMQHSKTVPPTDRLNARHVVYRTLAEMLLTVAVLLVLTEVLGFHIFSLLLGTLIGQWRLFPFLYDYLDRVLPTPKEEPDE